ncbi:zinc finger protein 717-like [Conger conger]|uniref:zinc finger protein 717-like n=1 Tax=Conger conger TaxID=82655 RepID=UPI002A5ACF64|nr:zinc finger protein 717-like [Conger conger]XP_061073463.1 zinc finger protein 717-like [Conger conger]
MRKTINRACTQKRLPTVVPIAGRPLVSLQVDQRVHAGGKLFVCKQCGMTFSKLCGLKVDKLAHVRRKERRCDRRGRTFSRLAYLKVHTCVHTSRKVSKHVQEPEAARARAHTGLWPYDCKTSFSSVWDLRIHQRTHTSMKPYLCSDCGKSFRQKGLLVVHHRRHTRSAALQPPRVQKDLPAVQPAGSAPAVPCR